MITIVSKNPLKSSKVINKHLQLQIITRKCIICLYFCSNKLNSRFNLKTLKKNVGWVERYKVD